MPTDRRRKFEGWILRVTMTKTMFRPNGALYRDTSRLMACYLLPSHPRLTCIDPLSVAESYDDPTFWQVIVAHVASFRASPNNTLGYLPVLIEDLAYSLHGDGRLDTSFLRQFLDGVYQTTGPTAERVLNNILECALSLPFLFPSHCIRHLSADNSIEEFSTLQVRSLVAHQLLGTLRQPQGNSWGTNLSCWYSSPQPLENAITGYLTTLFEYFKECGESSAFVKFEFFTVLAADACYESLRDSNGLAFSNLVLESTRVDDVRFPHGAIRTMIVSSNASPGFGASCTQEELITAACPELLPLGAVLLSVPVPSTAAIFAQNITPISRWAGQGRHARLIDKQKEIPCDFLLIDAAELDLGSSAFPDLEPAVLQRDLTKLLVGFSALKQHAISSVASPLWGAGSFGGDPVIKAIIISLVASFTQVKVHLSIDERRLLHAKQDSDHPDMTVLSILQQIQGKCQNMAVGDALSLLTMERVLRCCDGLEVGRLFFERNL